MNYPIWQIPAIGGGWIIAVVAILHVYIAHLAVGGGLFLVWTERKARKEGDPGLLEYTRRHTRFFMLLTLVFGAVTGVGIWFAISVVHPAATSLLIHSFVFGWAIEWTFFIGEIVALLLYYYLWDRLPPRIHLTLGWFYFAFAWLSLFVINGILSFMLTPGRWLESSGFWNGFFNPTFWPALAFRTAIALSFAGLFGLITALRQADADRRARLQRYCARWLLLPLVLVILGGVLYLRAIPSEALSNLLGRNGHALPYIRLLLTSTVLLYAGGILALIRLPRPLHGAITLGLVLIGLGWMAGFEYLREIARKPYVIHGWMYSNSIRPEEVETLNQDGYLARARWTRIRSVDVADPLPAGRELLVHQCLSCHTLGGGNDLTPLTADLTERGLEAHLEGQGRLSPYMPPFVGTEQERRALAAYLARDVHRRPAGIPRTAPITPLDVEIPPFDAREAEYTLLAWNDLGMHCISDSDPFFVILPPANTIQAQLIRRGSRPELVTDGVELTYRVQEGHQHPEHHVDFWKYVEPNFGVRLEPPVGLAGLGLSGWMEPDMEGRGFGAELIPVVPYSDAGTFQPYPLVDIEARSEQGELLARTRIVAPTSTEMGCGNCHGGGWRMLDRAGFTEATCRSILAAHDRRSGTSLLAEADGGRPRLCQSCHPDPVLNAAGEPGRLNLPAALHGFHAHLLPDRQAEACAMCHPAHPEGSTRCFRGRHAELGLSCVECHGTLEDHALSLLIHEEAFGKASARRLMRDLQPRHVGTLAEIRGRRPWVQEPDCLNCHRDFELEGIDGFNRWTPSVERLYRQRSDCRGVRCIACHGSPHAVYPAANPYGDRRDNLLPLQLQSVAGTIGHQAGCALCHTRDMEVEGHHRRMLRR